MYYIVSVYIYIEYIAYSMVVHGISSIFQALDFKQAMTVEWPVPMSLIGT